MPGLVSDPQSEIDDTSRSYPLLWGQSRAVSPADNGFGSVADPAVDFSDAVAFGDTNTDAATTLVSVSYTHLTLPTIYSV